MRYRNVDVHARVWPNLTHEGRTLRLEPDETVELDGEIADPWLRPVEKPKSKQTPDAKAEE